MVETLDRTNSVREVKLVFSTLAESLKFNGNSKKQKIQEGIASKPQAIHQLLQRKKLSKRVLTKYSTDLKS